MYAPIPTHIITGFLGAGKTTTINHLLAQLADESVLVVINEMGDIGIDAQLLKHPQSRILELNGGCMCCALRVLLETRLAAALRQHKPDRIIIEPTGVGHPRDLLHILEHGPLAQALSSGPHVVVCDPALHQRAQVREHPLYHDQWQVAHWAAISKAEISSEADLVCLRGDLLGQGLALAEGGRGSNTNLLAWPETALRPAPASCQQQDHHHHDHDHHDHDHHDHDHHHDHDESVMLPGHGYTSYVFQSSAESSFALMREWMQAMAAAHPDARIKALQRYGDKTEVWQLVAGRVDCDQLEVGGPSMPEGCEAVVIVPSQTDAIELAALAQEFALQPQPVVNRS